MERLGRIQISLWEKSYEISQIDKGLLWINLDYK